MSITSENNKRIAKNTLFLYVRMLLIMGVTLYTSRIVLQVLGVKDFGIYNVVGGVVSMMSFLNASMSLATQRALAFALGKGDSILLRKTFCMAINIHIGLCMLLVLLAETLGYWFLLHYLNIPFQSMDAAVWIYQFSILTTIVGILIVPFISLVVSHEHMQIYAYISIIEAIMKLSMAFLLLWVAFDKLKLYGVLLFCTALVVSLIWFLYCWFRYPGCRYRTGWDKEVFKSLSNFAGWQTIGSLCWLIRTQGVNVVLNIFFGPALNATRGIAVQVNTAVLQFVQGFQTASNPQLTKYYAAHELESMRLLIYRSSKFSFLLMFILALPILMETEAVLRVWLGIVPDYGVEFVRLMVISTLCELFSGTMVYGALATGDIRNYQIIMSSVLVSEIVLVYFAYKWGYPPQAMFYIEIVLYVIALFARLFILQRMIGLSVIFFIKKVISRELLVALLSLLVSYGARILLPQKTIAVMAVSVLSALLAACLVGLDRKERSWLWEKKKIIIKKYKSFR